MRWRARIAAILAGTVGLAAGAGAENRGLSPIILSNTGWNVGAGGGRSGGKSWSVPYYSTNAQSILDQVKTDLNLTQGEVTMLIPDMPNAPSYNVPVLIAQAGQAQSADVKTIRTLGVCFPASNDPNSGENVIDPRGSAGDYLYMYEHRSVAYGEPATITILQQPTHGVLHLVTEADRGKLFSSTSGPLDPAHPMYAYFASDYYEGKDQAIFLVDIGGVQVKVVYFFQVVPGQVIDAANTLCAKTGDYWKISSTLDANGNSTITSVDYLPAASDTLTSSSLADWLSLAQQDGALANLTGLAIQSGIDSASGTTTNSGPSITVSVADLPGAAVGQITGNNITLDTNAAGNGWFIDTTPADNSEFLPTADPNVWIAKQGSTAYGKMDMLSVLLHEYGHALGIQHSTNPYDFMNATLLPGERRLPTAEEFALMQQLIQQAKGQVATTDPFALSQSKGGTWFDTLTTNGSNNNPIPLDLPLGGSLLGMAGFLVRRPQYEAAVNPSFTSLDTSTAWQTQGSVDIQPASIDPSTGSGRTASATLNEVSGSQTRLNQVFMLGSTDRYLTFTLSGTALGYLQGAPQDAFQVALLDASTGNSLLTTTDGTTSQSTNPANNAGQVAGYVQTLSDAFLSLQADGTQNAADCVTCTTNADGSRTYRVDLSNVPKNIAVNLSFDLIGFGATDSHLTLSDLRVSGLPQLKDSTAAILEDNTYNFDQYAQADAQLRPLTPAGGTPVGAPLLRSDPSAVGSSVVTNPAHGTISTNADGTWTQAANG